MYTPSAKNWWRFYKAVTVATGHKNPFDGFAVEQAVPLSRHTSFRVGGPADYLAAPDSIKELTGLLKAAKKAGIPATFLGGGTNVLVSDDGVRGLVIRLTALKGAVATEKLVENPGIIRLQASAGQHLSSVCRTAVEKGLTGLEWAAGIPGTLGGAVMMNAGSFGSDMATVIHSIEVLDLATLKVKTIAKAELAFSYRSMKIGDAVILGAELNLAAADPETIQKVHDNNLKTKKSSQPVSQASAGCFFKNPSPEKPTGWLIEQAGLKGLVHKGAMVSDIHANFIVNQDHATCRDILDLAEIITARVAEKFNITLEKEVKLIGC